MSCSSLKLALLQHACEADPAKNWATASEMIRDAASRGADLVVTQELFGSLYFCRTQDEAHFELAQPIPGPATAALGELAKELGISLSASLFERRAAGLYHNTSVLIDPAGSLVGRYRKMHIPDDPSYQEKFYFTPGDLGFGAHAIRDGEDAPRVGMLVCWDQWFPEAARLTAMQGAQVLLYPTAIGWHADEAPDQRHAQLDAWITVQRSHAVANGLFVAAANRVGVEGDTAFWGNSFVADPMGRVLARASADQPQVLLADLDLTQIARDRNYWNLFFRDRRPEAYAGLSRRWGD